MYGVVDRYVGAKINEFLILVVIIFQVFDFFKLLDPFWDYVKKIVSWALIGYLFYALSPSNLFFGERRKAWDAAVVMAYFTMTLKNIVSFAVAARQAMLQEAWKYATLLPGGGGGTSFTVNEGAFNAFQFLGSLPDPTSIIHANAVQLTMNAGSIPITLVNNASVESVAHAVVQPFGLNGVILQFYNTLVLHAPAIERFSFIIGAVALLLLGLYAALRYTVEEHSVLALLHQHGRLANARHALTRLVLVFFALTTFFILVFNLVVEWLAIAVDAPLAMLGLATYGYLIFKFHRRTHRDVDKDDLVKRVGGFGVNFLKEFAQLFREWRTLLLGVSGLLVLHVLVEIGVFVIPYVTGLQDPLYFGPLGAGHEPLYVHVLAGASNASLATITSQVFLYVLNAVGILYLLALPAYIWYKSFRLRTRPAHEEEEEHHPSLPGWLVALGITSITSFLVTPAFKVLALNRAGLVGVDVQTQALATNNPLFTASTLLALFGVLWIFSSFKRFKDWSMAVLFMGGILFFAVYVVKFFLATTSYYARQAFTLFQAGWGANLFLGVWLGYFLCVSLLFYIFGYLSFCYEALKE